MRTAQLILVLALAVPVTATLPACETTLLFQGNPENATPEAGDWQVSEPILAPTFQDLWARTESTLDLMGFVPDTDRSRYDAKELVSKWVTHLAPTRFEGYRRRAHVKFEPAGKDWVVYVAVLKQRNADIDNPSNPAQAQWEAGGTDVSRTGLLLYRIRSAFDPELGGTLGAPQETPKK